MTLLEFKKRVCHSFVILLIRRTESRSALRSHISTHQTLLTKNINDTLKLICSKIPYSVLIVEKINFIFVLRSIEENWKIINLFLGNKSEGILSKMVHLFHQRELLRKNVPSVIQIIETAERDDNSQKCWKRVSTHTESLSLTKFLCNYNCMCKVLIGTETLYMACTNFSLLYYYEHTIIILYNKYRHL